MYQFFILCFVIISIISLHIDNKDVQLSNEILCQRYKQNRYIPPVDDWPLHYPKHYTPLTIIHHVGRRTETEVHAVAQKMVLMESAGISGSTIKQISDLFTPFEKADWIPYIILIEGAPGIGKTILSKEISVQWANHSILQSTRLLFLLFMRDPQVKRITNVASLVSYFCDDTALTGKITDWLVETEGKYLTILLDGYDEISEGNRNYFMEDIIYHQKLTKCSLVITSRPMASSHLHNIVDCRAEVLGFTKEDRLAFIQTALDAYGQTSKVKDIVDHLQSNPFLNALCNIPLNMTIFLCLIEDGIEALPKTQTKLFEKFVIMTIIHFLRKDVAVNVTTISNFNDLPHHYDHVIKELSQFAFLALQKDQLVFTLSEVRAQCPYLTPENWYGLGLLKPVRYFKPCDGCDHESFHFLHFAIQEYMAAHHIASLPEELQLKLLNNTFWKVRYYNTWIMYVGVTGGSSFIFKHFLTGNYFQASSWLFGTSAISSKILNDRIKSLYLLHCLSEADHEMLSHVENIFQGRIIDLSHRSLSSNDAQTLAVLLLRSPNKQWEMINLSHCNIDEYSCNMLYKMFHSQSIKVKVKVVNIAYSKINWESFTKLCSVLKSWQTEELLMSIDALYSTAMINLIDSIMNMYKHWQTNKIWQANEAQRYDFYFLGPNISDDLFYLFLFLFFSNTVWPYILINCLVEIDIVIVVIQHDGLYKCVQCNNYSLLLEELYKIVHELS